MADLKPLIRFRKHTVDEKQRALARLYKEAEQLQKQKEIIAQQMARESELAAEMGHEAQAYLGRFLEGARRKIRALDISLGKMDARIAAAQEDIRAAYNEMKKVEITQRTREEREQAARDKKESDTLDEVGIDGFRRGREE
jgi:flagellar export protein FliJ